MALITDREAPPDIPTTNTLAGLEDPDAPQPTERAEIYLSGAHVATLENPPEMNGRVVMLVELEVYEVGEKSLDGGEDLVQVRRCRRIGDMWRPGSKRPKPKQTKAEKEAEEEAEAAKNQAPLIDEDGQVSEDAAAPQPDGTDDLDDDEGVQEPPNLSVVGDQDDHDPANDPEAAGDDPDSDPEDDDHGRPPFSDGPR